MKRIRLIDLLSPERVVHRLEASSKRAAIEELLDQLITEGCLDGTRRAQALAALERREASQSTGLQSGVAVPHAEMEGIPELLGCLGLKPAGIEFDSLDSKPARLFILLLVPSNYIQAHVRTLAGIARLLNDRRLRQALLQAASADEVLELLGEAEGVRS